MKITSHSKSNIGALKKWTFFQAKYHRDKLKKRGKPVEYTAIKTTKIPLKTPRKMLHFHQSYDQYTKQKPPKRGLLLKTFAKKLLRSLGPTFGFESSFNFRFRHSFESLFNFRRSNDFRLNDFLHN